MNRFLLVVLVAAAAFAVGRRGPTSRQSRTTRPRPWRPPAPRGWTGSTKNQNADGSWGKTYTVAVTSFACLSYLSAADEPFDGDRGKALLKGLQFLMAQQKDGEFPQQGHTWIHGQGFGTLALSEAYGRSLLCKDKPDMDMSKVKAAVASAVKAIAKNQSDFRRLVVHARRRRTARRVHHRLRRAGPGVRQQLRHRHRPEGAGQRL